MLIIEDRCGKPDTLYLARLHAKLPRLRPILSRSGYLEIVEYAFHLPVEPPSSMRGTLPSRSQSSHDRPLGVCDQLFPKRET